MSTGQVDFLKTITKVCVLSAKQREMLYDDGYDTISSIIYWNYD